MNYVNREHLNTYLRGIKYLGQGHQGVCYLNERKKVVYKIFHSYFDNEEEYYKEEDLLVLYLLLLHHWARRQYIFRFA